MVGYPILNAELAKPPICQIDLHLRAQLPLRADRKYVPHYQHADHQHRIDRRPTCVRVVGRKLFVDPFQIENAVDLPDQMIRRYHLVEIKRIKELALAPLSPPHHRPLPRIAVLIHGITVQPQSQREFCNTIGGLADMKRTSRNLTMMTRSGYRRVPDPICLSLSRQPAIEDLSRTGMTTAPGPSLQVWPHTVLVRSDNTGHCPASRMRSSGPGQCKQSQGRIPVGDIYRLSLRAIKLWWLPYPGRNGQIKGAVRCVLLFCAL